MLRERLTALLEPVIADLGYELVLLEFSPNQSSAMLRLFIDGADGINLDDCAKVSREVAATLDVEDPIRQSYQLEVSSPGLDRPLVKPEHFQRFRGEEVKIELLAPLAGSNRRRFRGELLDATERDVTVKMPDGPVTLPLADIEKARLVPQYEKDDDKGSDKSPDKDSERD